MTHSTEAQYQVVAPLDDALGTDDATGIAARIRSGELDPVEAVDAAIARIEAVEPELGALAHTGFDLARESAGDLRRRLRAGDPVPPLAGVPSAFKDNIIVGGMPMTQGSDAVAPTVREKDGAMARALRGTGLIPLGMTAKPPFGWTAATERQGDRITKNPWDTRRTPGGSSGGAAALVASRALPVAHANDGGGSIRIPAAAAGLIGFKPSRGRHPDEFYSKNMPVQIISQGIVARSMRDVVTFWSAMEERFSPQGLLPIGHAAAAPRRRLRIGLVEHSPFGEPTDAATLEVLRTGAKRLEELGHEIIPTTAPVSPTFEEDFLGYWGLLGLAIARGGAKQFGTDFDASRLDPLTLGMAATTMRSLHRVPRTIRRLQKVRDRYNADFGDFDLYLNPVLAHETPKVGYLGADIAYETHLERVSRWATFTPLQNISGAPAISLPAGTAPDGMPIGIHLSARKGDDRVVLEAAREYEAAYPFTYLGD